MTRTDIETWLLASSPNGRALALPVRDLDRGVIPRKSGALELGPKSPDLDAEWIFDLRRLHRREHRCVPALGRVARGFDEPHDRGSGGESTWTTFGQSSRVCLPRDERAVRRRRSAPPASARSEAAPRSRGVDSPCSW